MRWLSPLLLLGGIVLVAIGIVNVRQLLEAPLDDQRGYLAYSVFPLVIGLWLVISGVYSLTRRNDE